MEPLKICIFTETYDPVVGGGETQARLLAEGLISKGHSVVILTRKSDSGLRTFEQIGEVQVYRIAPVGIGQLKKWGLILYGFPALIKLRKEYDLLFVSGYRIVGLTAVLICKLFRKKCVLKADSQGEMSGEFFGDGLERFGLSTEFFPFKIFLQIRNFILQKADAFTAISDEIAVELTSNHITPQKIHFISNCVDTGRFFPVDLEKKFTSRKLLGLPECSTVVIYTGRLVSYKGLPLLLKVWQEIQKQHKDVRLLLVGAGGLDIHNCEAELRAYVDENDLDETVHFTGNIKYVPEYLQVSDFFVFPTENDAFPSSLIEGMSCGLAVITTPVGAIKMIIKNQQNGLLVQPGNYEQLYQAIETLILDPSYVTRLGQAAWKTVQEKYSAELVVNKYLNLFHKIAYE